MTSEGIEPSNKKNVTPILERIEQFELVFIATFGRSGSTLLQMMLNQHPQVIATLEQPFILVTYHYFHQKKNWSDRDIKKFIRQIWLRKSAMKYQWGINEDDLEQDLIQLRNSGRLNFRNACKCVYANNMHFNKEIKIIIDKNPIYLAHLDKIISVFQDSKFIILLRDYRAIFYSLSNYKNRTIKSMYTNLISIKKGAIKLLNHLETPSFKHTLLRYEDLVETPSSTLIEICSFLNISFNNRMLHYNKENYFNNALFKKQPQQFQQNIRENHIGILSRINIKSIDKWKESLSKNQIMEIEYHFGEYGERLGYTRLFKNENNNKVSNFRFKYKLADLKSELFINYIFKLPFWIHNILVHTGNKVKRWRS